MSVPVRHGGVDALRQLEGRVVDAGGLPVEGAQLELRDARHHTPVPLPPRPHRDGRAKAGESQRLVTGADGRFELACPAAELDLHVRHPQAGTAVVRRVRSDRGPLAIRLGGDGYLEGRLLDGAGAPLAAWTLHAVAADLRAVEGQHAPTLLASLEGADGHLVADAATDSTGRFRLAALAPQRFELFASKDGGPRLRLTDAPLFAAAADLELVLRHAQVRVTLTRDGVALPLRDDSGASLGAPARVVLAHADELGRSTGFVCRPRFEERAHVFAVEPGGSYLLRVVAGEATLHDELLRIPYGAGPIERHVALPPLRPNPAGSGPVRVGFGSFAR